MMTLKRAFTAGEELTLSLWRANLGLYGYGYDFAKTQYQRSRKLLDNLVDHGTDVEQQARDRLHTLNDEIRDHLVIPSAKPIKLLSERQLKYINFGIDTYNTAVIRITGATKPKPTARKPRARKAVAAEA